MPRRKKDSEGNELPTEKEKAFAKSIAQDIHSGERPNQTKALKTAYKPSKDMTTNGARGSEIVQKPIVVRAINEQVESFSQTCMESLHKHNVFDLACQSVAQDLESSDPKTRENARKWILDGAKHFAEVKASIEKLHKGATHNHLHIPKR